MEEQKIGVIIAQVFISFMMALIMTFIFGTLPFGLHPGWVGEWMLHFAAAWPVAFVLSLGLGPLAFWLARKVMRVAKRA